MNLFLERYLNQKKFILLTVIVIYVAGFFYGFYQYHLCHNDLQKFFQYLFYIPLKGYQNHYHFYLIQTGVYIIISTYLSSNYLGSIGLLFLTFLNGMRISFSLMFVFAQASFNFFIFFTIVIEILIEIILCLFMSTTYSYLSLYTFYVTFITEQNFNIKKMANHKLNIIILSLVIFGISLMFRIYIVPLMI